MGRTITRTGYSTLGALATLGGLASAGAASVAVQLDGVIWWLLGVVFVAAAAGFFWLAVKLLMRGRLHPTDERPPADPGGGHTDAA